MSAPAEADLTKVNPALLEQWIRQTLDAAGMTSGTTPVLTPQETAQFIGHLNSVFLPMKLGRTPSSCVAPMKNTKSQLVVCGAPVMTNLGTPGWLPASVQPFQW